MSAVMRVAARTRLDAAQAMQAAFPRTGRGAGAPVAARSGDLGSGRDLAIYAGVGRKP